MLTIVYNFTGSKSTRLYKKGEKGSQNSNRRSKKIIEYKY